eukprot:CAMPEP_0180548466 /NCGR_PEP_ID=MMETSP1036_2-20121128/71624_1 /TAXON_ID=632150 /ORGANISM="Azadinium spinosum, Strain 3D9" /LENGTH=244 /DNA_ID=CAMNT_0022563649 /DNA_START=340 /DNA_END=1074 /DNA_ORIENTATION=+
MSGEEGRTVCNSAVSMSSNGPPVDSSLDFSSTEGMRSSDFLLLPECFMNGMETADWLGADLDAGDPGDALHLEAALRQEGSMRFWTSMGAGAAIVAMFPPRLTLINEIGAQQLVRHHIHQRLHAGDAPWPGLLDDPCAPGRLLLRECRLQFGDRAGDKAAMPVPGFSDGLSLGPWDSCSGMAGVFPPNDGLRELLPTKLLTDGLREKRALMPSPIASSTVITSTRDVSTRCASRASRTMAVMGS